MTDADSPLQTNPNSRRRPPAPALPAGALVLALLLGACVGTPSPATQEQPPHIVLILADDMGYGDLGSYNPASKIPTPHVDRLARAGMRFTDAHAAGSLCHPSRYGLLTGRYPWRTTLPWREHATIDAGRTTVGSLLQAHGYRTAMVGKWHLGFERAPYDQPQVGGPVDRGFDSFFGIRASTDIPPYYYIRGDRVVTPPTDSIPANNTPGWSDIQGAFWRAGGIAPGLDLADVLPRFTDEAVDVIEGHAASGSDAPLMLYLAFPAPHTPWLPTEAFEGRSGAGLYGDFTVMVDSMVGRVLGALDAAGMAENTLVLFSSDNGPVWYDADVERLGHDAAGGLRGMKGDAWEAGHRMPFVVRWPGQVEAGAVSDRLVSFTDVLATLAEVVGATLPADAGEDSFSFLPSLLGAPSEDGRTGLVLASARDVYHVREGRWKLIEGLGSGGFSRPGHVEPGPGEPRGQLYDLEADPGERHNLYDERPDVVRRLTALLERTRTADRSRPAD